MCSSHAQPCHVHTRMVDEQKSATYRHASALLAAVSESLESVSHLSRHAKRTAQLQRAAEKQHTVAY